VIPNNGVWTRHAAFLLAAESATSLETAHMWLKRAGKLESDLLEQQIQKLPAEGSNISVLTSVAD
jgi:hypothetical protein